MFRAFITNLGKYNEGELIGEWVDFPCYEMDEVLERIGINEEYEEMFITDYESDVTGFEIGMHENLDDLNEYAEELEAIGADLVGAYLEAYGGSLAHALDDVENCTWYPGYTLLDVAYELIEECYDLPEVAQRYFDYDAFARDLSLDGYTETSAGVICL